MLFYRVRVDRILKSDERKPQIPKSRNLKLDHAFVRPFVQFQVSGFWDLRFPFVRFQNSERRMLRKALALFSLLLATSSCGYHVAGKWLDAGRGLTIAVPTFTNRTTAYRIEQMLSEALRQELIRRTKFTVQPQETGDVVVNGEVSNIILAPVIFNPQGRGSTYTVIVDLKITITDKRSNALLFQNDHLTQRDVFELAQNSAEYVPEDSAAMDRLARRFASYLVDSLLHAKP